MDPPAHTQSTDADYDALDSGPEGLSAESVRARRAQHGPKEVTRDAGRSVTGSVVYGTPHRRIRTYVESEGIDLLVLGTQGRTEFSWCALGGVSSTLVRSSPVPLLMTRTPED